MKRKPRITTNINGVVQRQRRRSLGDFNDVQQISGDSFEQEKGRSINKALDGSAFNNTKQDEVEIIREEDIIESTRSKVDESQLEKGGWRARRKRRKLAKKRRLAKKPRWYRITRNAFKYIGIFAILTGGYFVFSSLNALDNIIDRGGDGALALQDNILPSELRGEGDGRINIMLLGIGGEEHVAGDLADSIIIASIDPFANELALLHIPRDLYVEIPGYGSTRINAAHAYGELYEHPGGGIALMKETLQNALDIKLHYYVRVDFEGFREAVNTVGGITINLEEAVYDPNFDWQFGRNALMLPAGENKLDGQTALLLARSRNVTGRGYGTGSDFDRGENQRKILIALKDKILSLGTFSNPVKLNSLLSSAGNHVRTNLQIPEMLRVYEIMEQIPSNKIVSYGLDTSAESYLTPTSIAGASVLIPRSGSFNDIQLFVREIFVDGFIKQEQPLLDVYNGTVTAGMASETATDLATYGYKINTIDNANKQDYAKSVLYDLSDGNKPFTKSLLENRFDTVMRPAGQIPNYLKTTEADFVIIIGDNYVQTESTY